VDHQLPPAAGLLRLQLHLSLPAIVFLVLFPFNDNIIPSLPFRGFTLRWYQDLTYDFVMRDALLIPPEPRPCP
jgi:ABC-type spermidine/putrescine transport system permease subunit II